MFYQTSVLSGYFARALPTRLDFFVEDFSLITVGVMASLLIGVWLTLCLTIFSLLIYRALSCFGTVLLRQSWQFRASDSAIR